MRVFIPSYNRAASIVKHTWALLRETNPTVVVHSHQQAAEYRLAGIPTTNLWVSGVPAGNGGVNRQRDFILHHLADPGEWVLMADDNIRALTALSEKYYGDATVDVKHGHGPQWRTRFAQPCPVDRLMAICAETVMEATRVGAHYCGFAVVDNPYFRSRKFRHVGYVIAKLALWHNVPGFAFDFSIKGMNDHRNSSEHLLQFGRVVINNYLFPVAPHYEPGGMGTYEERLPQRLLDIDRLLFMYPGLWRVIDRDGYPQSDLRMRLHTPQQIDRWRYALLHDGCAVAQTGTIP